MGELRNISFGKCVSVLLARVLTCQPQKATVQAKRSETTTYSQQVFVRSHHELALAGCASQQSNIVMDASSERAKVNNMFSVIDRTVVSAGHSTQDATLFTSSPASQVRMRSLEEARRRARARRCGSGNGNGNGRRRRRGLNQSLRFMITVSLIKVTCCLLLSGQAHQLLNEDSKQELASSGQQVERVLEVIKPIQRPNRPTPRQESLFADTVSGK